MAGRKRCDGRHHRQPGVARDIRRVIANATALQTTDRANIVLRVLSCLKACGVGKVVMMPEKRGGIRHHVRRGIDRADAQRTGEFPQLSHLDWKITGTVADTMRAARDMKDMGVSAIVVLGGDGTHRAVVSACGDVPIAGIWAAWSSAFAGTPRADHHRTGRRPRRYGQGSAAHRLRPQQAIGGACGRAAREIALVDVAVVTERYIGTRALWRTDTFRELFVTFADPEVIGMSAIAGLLKPVTGQLPRPARQAGGGPGRQVPCQHAITPAPVRGVGIRGYGALKPGKAVAPEIAAGSIALDGERESTSRS